MMVMLMMMGLVDPMVMLFDCLMNGDTSDDKLDDGDFLGQLLRHTKAEVLVASAKG